LPFNSAYGANIGIFCMGGDYHENLLNQVDLGGDFADPRPCAFGGILIRQAITKTMAKEGRLRFCGLLKNV